MIPKECKRLAEVDFPIAEVSRHAAREKSIRHGHPSTLHLWWARRPLASSRAVLMALLMPDPCDPNCPEEFKTQARDLLLGMRGRPSGWDSTVQTDEGLRQVILKFIADFSNWDNAAKAEYLEACRGLVKAAHPEEIPLVVDPFAGGGSIPLEALRMGCETFASDLNPVACLILKVMLEDTPRRGSGLIQEASITGARIRKDVERRLSDLYPKEDNENTPVAYLWARTVRCEAPNCGAEIPLMRSMWLCKNPKRRRAFRHRVVNQSRRPPQIELEIFEPKTEREVANGTVNRAKATCPCCRAVMPPNRVRAQLSALRGGSDVLFDEKGARVGGALLTAIVTSSPNQKQRHYRLANDEDYTAIFRSQNMVTSSLEEWERDGKLGPCPIPDEPLPLMSGTFNVPLYGMNRWGDLLTNRQKATFIELTKQFSVAGETSLLSLGKVARHLNVLSKWHTGSETVAGAFGMQALPMSWDFPEMYPLSSFAGGIEDAINGGVEAISSIIPMTKPGLVEIADAVNHPLPNQSAEVWFTDPPYYFAIPYADLSDFFFVWLKRAQPNNPKLRDPFDADNILTPKEAELCEMARWDPNRYAHKDAKFFEDGMAKAFAEGRRVLRDTGIASVVFAHKTTEGWEALLSGMIRGGWTITCSWPIATERGARLRARESAALATSIHLVCRPRREDAPVGEWADILRELPVRVGDWMQRLQSEGVRGADLVFACIGPALEIYSRYSSVETPEGNQVELAEYLERVWEVVAREALEQVLGTAEAQARNGTAGALEEDARLTALFLWTLQSTDDEIMQPESETDEADQDDEDEGPAQRHPRGLSMPFDVARRFAQPLGIHMEEWENRIINTDKGVVRLRPVADRARELFGEAGADSMADEIESNAASSGQLSLFPDEAPAIRGRARRGRRAAAAITEDAESRRDATTLDRIHAAMLLQASGRTEALRNLIRAEQDRGPDFLRLSNALSALYPRGSDEKRLLDGMLLAAPR